MKKINKRIDKMNQAHLALLKMVKESLSSNRNNFNESVVDVVQILNASELDAKQYKAVIEAQELITDLTQEIVNATSSEDIINLRKKLNYYINKIKNILKNRNVEESVIDTYLEKTTTFRKDIARYLRESNINAINESYNNLANLSAEELKELKKSIRREISYNTRNLNPQPKKRTIKKPTVTPKEEVITPIETINEELLGEVVFPDIEILPPEDKSNESIGLIPLPSIFSRPSVYTSMQTISEIDFADVDEKFTQSAATFSRQYQIVPTYDYEEQKPAHNMVRFFHNLPRYIHNKKALKLIERDSAIYYRGSDLISFREYVRQRNSISQALRCIFSRSYLFTEEATYLNHHQQCSQWLFNYCKNHSLELPMQYFEKRTPSKAF